MAKHWLAAPPIDAGLADVELPIALTEDDRCWLEGVLPDLPSLRYPIPDEVRIAFLTAYRNLKERRAWEPRLVSRQNLKQDALFANHRNTLERMFEAGALSLFNQQRAPVASFSVRALISRSAAIAYLEQHGFEYGDPLGNWSGGDMSKTQTEEQSAAGDNRLQPGERKLSPETVRELVKFHNALKEANKKRGTGKRIPFVKLTAERFGVSRRYVFDLVKGADEAVTDEGRIDHLLVKKTESH